jgi:hypothetical protein
MSMLPPSMRREVSACMPSSPVAIVKVPPAISMVPFVWTPSSAESIVKVPPVMTVAVADLRPFVETESVLELAAEPSAAVPSEGIVGILEPSGIVGAVPELPELPELLELSELLSELPGIVGAVPSELDGGVGMVPSELEGICGRPFVFVVAELVASGTTALESESALDAEAEAPESALLSVLLSEESDELPNGLCPPPISPPPMPPNWLSPDFTSALALPPPVVMSNVPSRIVSVEEAEMPSCWALIVKVPPAM